CPAHARRRYRGRARRKPASRPRRRRPCSRRTRRLDAFVRIPAAGAAAVTATEPTAPNGEVSLTGQRTRLREFVSADGAAAYSIVGDDRVTKFLSFDSRSPAAAQE